MTTTSPASVIARVDDHLRSMLRTDMVTTDLASGGRLAVEVADRFIEAIFNQPMALNECQKIKMGSWQMQLPKISLGTRLLQAAPADNVALADARRVAPTFSNVTLTAAKYFGEVWIPNDSLLDNVEKGAFEQTLFSLFAKRIANDSALAFWYGDTVAVDADPATQAFLRVQDGIFKQLTTNTFSHGSVAVSDALFSNAVKALPSQYRGDISNFRFYLHPNCAWNWKTLVGSRSTIGGDTYALGAGFPPAGGIPVIPDPTIVSTGGVASGLLINPKNILWGIWQDITFARWPEPRLDHVVFVVKMRIGMGLEFEDAGVEITNIATA